MPSASADDGAFWRRARRIVFDMVVPEDQRDRDLPEKLKAPEVRSAVLAWLVEGCVKWQASPTLREPSAVLDATAEYREDNDPITDWLSEQCLLGPQYTAKPGELWGSYRGWLAGSASRGLSAKDFTKALEAKDGIKAERGAGKKPRLLGWRGITLRRGR
jgi:putative DNA primase/helicase